MIARRLGDVRALGRFVDVLVADPAQAVAGDFVAEFAIRRDALRDAAAVPCATANTVSGKRRARTHAARATSRRANRTRTAIPCVMWRIGNASAPMISERNVSEAASPCSTLFSAPSS